MKIRFSEILDEGLHLDIKDEAWFPDDEVRRRGAVSATVLLQKKGEERVFLQGHLQTEIFLQCDRCLKEYVWPLEDTFAIDLEVAKQMDEEPVEHACGPEEMDTLELRHPEIDINQVLHQQVLLLIPAKKICAATCRGLCPRCGVDLNVTTCDCDTDEGFSPFSVLGTLNKR